ncbi:MAG: Na+/H+ antiporter NhaA [Alphaproteobacteria bacterium]|nr:Na+/H+ antiporter NhaA [Alphaproteobacteria bacterium]
MYPFHLLYRLMKKEVSGGACLVLATVLALWMANSAYGDQYANFVHIHIGLAFGDWHFDKSIQHFVNDALMAIFFLLVGLEIKREFKEGHLSSFDSALLPFVAAIFGMAVPALIYISLNSGDPVGMRGWAIPAATDIAFAIGIMALLGKRVPISLKVLLVAIAVIDDLGAILVIALFYNTGLNYEALSIALGVFLVMLFLNRRGVHFLTPYMMLGFILWIFVFLSGIHATLAGVLTALAVPLYPNSGTRSRKSPLRSLEHAIAPWVNFTILPIFAFMNAGVNFGSMAGEENVLMQPIALGILLGLFFGKQIGIFTSVFLMVRLRISPMPSGTGWTHIYAMSALCGIGFTMSLFIGALAYPSGDYDAQVRAGVFVASLVSAVFGYVLLFTRSKGTIAAGDRAERQRAPRRNYNMGNNPAYSTAGGRRNYQRSRGGGGNRSNSRSRNDSRSDNRYDSRSDNRYDSRSDNRDDSRSDNR